MSVIEFSHQLGSVQGEGAEKGEGAIFLQWVWRGAGINIFIVKTIPPIQPFAAGTLVMPEIAAQCLKCVPIFIFV